MSYKRWIIVAALLFSAGLILGLASPGSISLFAEDIAALEELADFLESLPPFLVFIIIFLKNVSVLLFGFILSPLLCLVPILSLTVNGWLLGFVSVIVAEEKSVAFVLAGILPHGIFEIPALILGQAAALGFGAAVILALFKEERRKQILPTLKQNLKYLLIAVILLLPAAIIETYLTPLLLT
ncbi:MAG: stage II sporulation protein M [Dehalococcoidia bacterium]|nr:MAG: stage II sporulation protein M [Dehalococcoidia bacterium]